MPSGKAWTVRDRYVNDIYLTWERWGHIVEPDNHAEVEPFFDRVAETIRLGQRRQDRYDVNGYQYYRPYPDLPDDNNHLVVYALPVAQSGKWFGGGREVRDDGLLSVFLKPHKRDQSTL